MENNKQQIPEPKIQRQIIDYSNMGFWKKSWIYFTTPTEFKVVDDWFFVLPNGQKALIKAGFIYDGASIPFFLRPFMTSFGPLNRGASIHDHGYRRNLLYNWEGEEIYKFKGQKFWDDLLKDVVSFTTDLNILSVVVWLGARGFGTIAWNKRRLNS